MSFLKKIQRDRINPEEFQEKMTSIPLTDAQFRDLFNRGSLEIEGYKSGLRKDGREHTPPTVAEALVLDLLEENPDMLEELLEIARSRILEE